MSWDNSKFPRDAKTGFLSSAFNRNLRTSERHFIFRSNQSARRLRQSAGKALLRFGCTISCVGTSEHCS